MVYTSFRSPVFRGRAWKTILVIVWNVITWILWLQIDLEIKIEEVRRSVQVQLFQDQLDIQSFSFSSFLLCWWKVGRTEHRRISRILCYDRGGHYSILRSENFRQHKPGRTLLGQLTSKSMKVSTSFVGFFITFTVNLNSY